MAKAAEREFASNGSVSQLGFSQAPLSVPLALTPSPDDARDTELVTLIRGLARESRLAGRQDIDRACALISAEPGDAVRRYGLALLAALSDVATVRLVFHTTGAAERSFGERWLTSLVASALRSDEDSVRFAIDRVVCPRHRRAVRFLARGFATAWGDLQPA